MRLDIERCAEAAYATSMNITKTSQAEVVQLCGLRVGILETSMLFVTDTMRGLQMGQVRDAPAVRTPDSSGLAQWC